MKRWPVLLTAAAVAHAGCVGPVKTHDHYATDAGRQSLGRVAYVTGNFEPATRTIFLKRNRWHGAGIGMGEGVLACGQIMSSGDVIGLFIWLVISPVCGVVGAVVGAAGAAPSEAVSRADAMLAQNLERLAPNAGLQTTLAAHVAALGLDLQPLPLARGPVDPDVAPAYDRELQEIADTVLEYAVLRLDTYSPGDDELNFHLRVRARARLVQVRNGAVLDEFEYTHASVPTALSALGSDAPKYFDDQIAQAYRSIIDQAAVRWPRLLAAPAAASDRLSAHAQP